MKKVVVLLFILSISIFAAGYANSAYGGTQIDSADSDDGFRIITDLDSVKEIHTDQQKAFLEYEGNYESIPEADYPDGEKELSIPEPVKLEWEYAVPSGKTISSYDVIVGQREDLSDGYTIKGSSDTRLDIFNSYLGFNYFRIIANYSDGTSNSSKIYRYIVDDVYPRNLKIVGMTNCRDMGGGRKLENGGYIKQGLIFRTSSTNGWGKGVAVVPDTITAEGKEVLLGQLGCRTEINVNNGGNDNYVGVENFVVANMWYEGGKHHLYRNAEPLKVVFHILADESNYPVFYHCRIGTDRTGLVAIVLSGLLGVSENLIYQDYLFSNFGNIQEKRFIGEKADRNNIQKYVDDLKAFPGETFQNKVYNYMLSIGIPAEELNSIINILTEGGRENDNENYQVLILAKDMMGKDTDIKESDNYAHPPYYYTLGYNQSVSMSFEAEYAGEAYLVAYLGSNDDSESTFIHDSIKVAFDGNEVDINKGLTFSNAGFGEGDNRTYYSAVVLGKVNVSEGRREIYISGIANDLNIGAVTIIPVNRVKQEEVEIDLPVFVDESSEPEEAIEPSHGNKKFLLMFMGFIFVLGAVILFLKQKRK